MRGIVLVVLLAEDPRRGEIAHAGKQSWANDKGQHLIHVETVLQEVEQQQIRADM